MLKNALVFVFSILFYITEPQPLATNYRDSECGDAQLTLRQELLW